MITFERTVIDCDTVKFTAVENETVIGNCTLRISSPYAEVSSLSYSDNKSYVIEGLIKAALYYASLNCCYIGRCNCHGIDLYAERMNFIKSETGYENDIPSILMGSCSGCKNNI